MGFFQFSSLMASCFLTSLRSTSLSLWIHIVEESPSSMTTSSLPSWFTPSGIPPCLATGSMTPFPAIPQRRTQSALAGEVTWNITHFTNSLVSCQIWVSDNKCPDPRVYRGDQLQEPLHADSEQLHHELVQQARWCPLLLPHVDLTNQEWTSLDWLILDTVWLPDQVRIVWCLVRISERNFSFQNADNKVLSCPARPVQGHHESQARMIWMLSRQRHSLISF